MPDLLGKELRGPGPGRPTSRPAQQLHAEAAVIGRAHHLVVDCPDPAALAEFYSELLGLPVTYRSEDFVVVSRDTMTSGYAFQRAPDHQPPRWPDPARPQQMHLDVMVDDQSVVQRQALALGARLAPAGDHVYLDPAGHPFCLIPSPGWAPPVQEA